MARRLLEVQLKLRKAWLKLLKAEARHKEGKVAKWEKKVLELELELNKLK
jgi:hypothetical protein